MHDLVIRGGTLIDGTGAPPRQADLAIDAGRIAAIGEVSDGGGREIDATGLIVTPGFVDVHTHYDGQATWDSYLEPSIYHGVTTVVMGNCGVGFAPADPSRHDWLIGLMEGVEDIPGTALAEGITWDWESFPEYLDALEKVPHSIDLAAQLPHGALRAYVMGERGADHTAVPSEDEITQMRRLAREAVEAGAVGFTTSRTRNHKTVDGEPTPSLTSTPEELWGISDGLGDAGQGVFEIVCDFVDLESEFALIREMALRSGRPVSLSLAQVNHKPDEWKRVLELIDEANAAGARMFAQVAPRPIGVVSNLDSSLHPFLLNKAYQSVAHLPLPERAVALRDPELRRQIVDDDARMVFDLEHLYEFSEPPNYEPEASESIAARAEREGADAKLMALDALLEDEGQGMLFCPVLNYANGNSDHSREMLLHPSTLPGLGDGGAHVSFISDASFATYLLTHWARDRKRGEKLPLEFLVKRQTHDTARLVGFDDRGVLAPGMKADINVIDFEALNLLLPEMRYDLPAGGKRLVQRATGYRFTIVSGVIVMENDAPTGEMPGRLLRGPQAAPVV